MATLPLGRTRVSLPYHAFRNISAPEDVENSRKVYSGCMPALAVLELPTDQNVREYLVDPEGKKRHALTSVHKAIRDTLRDNPDNFSILNGGVVVVARGFSVDETKKLIHLADPSIINGSQTQGVIRDVHQEYVKSKTEFPPIHITFEIIITDNEDLIAEISVARNFQNDVAAVSIAGRRGQFDELEAVFRASRPDKRLRKKETDLSDDFLDTERLLQVITALVPDELWPNADGGAVSKVHTYSMKARCLKDFSEIYKNAKDQSNPEHTRYSELYQFFLDIAAQAWDLYGKWKAHQGFRGTALKAIIRGDRGVIVEVPDGIIFPILASLSAFAAKREGKWVIAHPEQFRDEDLINAAKSAYQEIAKSNPSIMGKTKACYSSLAQITSIYKRLAQSS